MKPFVIISLVIVLIAGSVTGYYFLYNTKIKTHLAEGPENIRDEEEWDLMRHRDPKTGKIPDNIRFKELQYAASMPNSFYSLKKSGNKMLGNTWQNRGPWNIGGRTRAIGIDILNSKIINAGGVSGGMWRTTDGGLNWYKTTKPDQLGAISCIVQDTRKGKENIWYAGTGEFLGNSSGIYGNGIYKSTDNGASWSILGSTTNGSLVVWDNNFDFVWRVAVNTANLQEDEVLAATCAGAIVRSTDGGSTWKIVLGGYGNNYGYFTDISISAKGVYYSTISKEAYVSSGSLVYGIFRSTDGQNWTNITPDAWSKKFRRIVLAISPSNENQIYFLSETPGTGKLTFNYFGDSLYHSFWKYTYLSGDGKGSNGQWEDRSSNLPKPANLRGHFNSQSSYDLALAVKPDNSDMVFIGGTNIYRSNDGFKTADNFNWMGGYSPFEQFEYNVYPNNHPDIHTLLFDPGNSNTLYSGNDGGVSLTSDPTANIVNWNSLNNGYLTTQFYTIALNHYDNSSNEIIGGLQDNSTYITNSTDSKKSWTLTSKSDGFSCQISKNRTYYTSHNSFYQPKIKMWKIVLDNNDSMLSKTRIDPIGGKDFIWCTPFVVDPNDENLMYLAGGSILWRNSQLTSIPNNNSLDSTNLGWDSLGTTRVPDKHQITAVSVSNNTPNSVFYGTSLGFLYKIDNANKGVPSPVNITSVNFPKNAYINCIAVDPHNSQRIAVCFSNYQVESIFLSTDGGQNFNAVSGNLEQNPGGSGDGPAVHWFEFMKIGGKDMYIVGTSTGIYSTAFLDGSYTVWQQEGAIEVGNTVVDMIDYRESDNLVVAGTHGNGVFSTNIQQLPSTTSQPVLSLPSNGSHGLKPTVNFIWNQVPGAVFYKMELAKDPDFKNIVVTEDGLRSNTITEYSLDVGYIDYYWRVTAMNTGGLSQPSDTWTFRSMIKSPDIIYPAAVQDSIPLNIRMKWENIPQSLKYHLQISTSFSFKTFIVNDSNVKNNYYDISGLIPNTKYYWKITSIDNDGESLVASPSNFRTINSTGIVELNSNKTNLIKNVYPNPISSICYIETGNIVNDDVIIKLFDQNGRNVKTICNNNPNINSSYSFNTHDLSSGNYILQVINGKNTDYRNVIVLHK